MAATIPAQRAERQAAGPSDQHKDRDGSEGQRAGLVEAAGAPAAQLALERAQNAAACSDYEDAETGAQEQKSHAPRRRKLGLIEGGDQGNGGGGRRKQEPSAAAHPEIGQRAPEEVNSVRKRKQRCNARGARGIHAFIAQQIGDGPTDEAEGNYRVRRDKEGEKPRAFARRRRGLGLYLRPSRWWHVG
ncbi:MAG: hypothetical protein WDM87_15275 [Terracidiphilus sp.]